MKTGRRKILFSLVITFLAFRLFADPLSQWTWRYPNPQGYTLRGVTYGGGQFVAVGDAGTIITSPDGYNWTVRSFNVFPGLLGVTYASGQYAAVGNGGVILVSSDAINWTQTTSPTTNTLRGIAGDSSWQISQNPQFMAVGDYGTLVQSANGANWSLISSGITNSLFAVTLAQGYHDEPSLEFYAAVGNGATIYTYGQADTFQIPQSSIGITNNLYGIAFATNGVAAACGDLNYLVPNQYGQNFAVSNGILFSLDYGFIWTNQMWLITELTGSPNAGPPSDAAILRAAAWGTNGFVAVGDTGYTLEYNYPGVVLTSQRGTNWNQMSWTTSDSRLYGATFGNGLYVLVGDAGAIVVSRDLTNFTEINGYHRSAITAISCSQNLCIASALSMSGYSTDYPNFTTIISSNGGYWVESTSNFPSPGLAGLANGGNEFVGVGPNGVFTTTDGANWQNIDTFSNILNGVCYANGRFIVVGNNGSIYSSPDGTNWSNYSITTTGNFTSVAYGNGMYLAVGSVAAASVDGMTWALASTNLPATIFKLVYGKNLFVASGYTGDISGPTGQILTSPDGVNWQRQFNAGGELLTGLAYTGGTFLTVSANGEMLQSSDGTNWVALEEPVPIVDNGVFRIYYEGQLYNLSLSDYGNYVALASFNGTFLAGNLDGILVQSGNTWNPAALSPAQVSTNGVTFSYNQQIDVPYHIQTSTNLVNWTSIYSGTGIGQPTNFTYLSSNNSPAQFFRLVSP